MRILVLSNTPWDDNNSFGNTYSNIFQGMKDVEFLNIYCRSGNPQNGLPMKCFQITPKMMIRSIFNRDVDTGKMVDKVELNAEEMDRTSASMFNFASRKRWIILFWIRELIWLLGKWRSKSLLKFLDDSKPDIIFQPIYGQGSAYINRIALFLKDYTGVPMFGYISDDCYSLRQYSLSPLYWIDRIARRPIMRRVMQSCKVLYVVSETQKREYEKMLNVTCKVLTKGIKDVEILAPPVKTNYPQLRMIYAGNIVEGRWKSLAMVGKVLDKLSNDEASIDLDVYTRSMLSKKEMQALEFKHLHLKGAVPAVQVFQLYNESDILLHVESLDYKDSLIIHQSFSTKLVDYLKMGKCIFAVGPKDAASIEYLINNDAAIVATTEAEIEERLNDILKSEKLIVDYGMKANQSGIQNHRLQQFQQMLLDDFKKAIMNN